MSPAHTLSLRQREYVRYWEGLEVAERGVVARLLRRLPALPEPRCEGSSCQTHQPLRVTVLLVRAHAVLR